MPTVWISRPSHRARQLILELSQYGITSEHYPALQIKEIADSSAITAYLKQVERFALSIFVSREASSRIAALLPSGKTLPALPALAIGRATIEALSKRYRLITQIDSIGDSQQLLHMPVLQNCLGDVAVLGGSNDKNSIPSPSLCYALKMRGNTVTPVICYRRLPAAANPTLTAAGKGGKINAAVAYSSDTLCSMLAMTNPDNNWLRAIPLFVIHDNIAVNAKQLGFQQVVVADDVSMVQVISHHLNSD